MSFRLRDHVVPEDAGAVRALVEATTFFSEEELAIAVELVEARLTQGAASGYFFVMAEDAEGLVGYTCYGPTPATKSSFDMYWIAVHPRAQGLGVGRRLAAETERAIAAMRGTRVWVETSGREQYRPTRGFYLAAGYTVAATLDDFYAPGESKVIFVKTVGA
jgi:ribosomal protein S18 acetylase RimI-like enzyme